MLCYRLGSKTTPEANAFVVPLQWIGVHHDDVERFHLPAAALQDLTAIDEAKAASLARDPAVAADPLLSYEAARFLEDGGIEGSCGGRRRRVKMEIEGVLGRGMHFLAGEYLPIKLQAIGDDAAKAGALLHSELSPLAGSKRPASVNVAEVGTAQWVRVSSQATEQDDSIGSAQAEDMHEESCMY